MIMSSGLSIFYLLSFKRGTHSTYLHAYFDNKNQISDRNDHASALMELTAANRSRF